MSKIDQTESFHRQPGSDHPRTVNNVGQVESLVRSQKDYAARASHERYMVKGSYYGGNLLMYCHFLRHLLAG